MPSNLVRFRRGLRGTFVDQHIPPQFAGQAHLIQMSSPDPVSTGMAMAPDRDIAMIPPPGQLAALMSPAGAAPQAARSVADQMAAAGQTQATVIQPPWVVEPASSQPFMYQSPGPGQAALTLQAVGADQTIVSFKVPTGKNGVIKWIANVFFGFGFNDGSGGLVWRMQADSAVIQGWSNVMWSMGSMVQPGAFSIRIFENQTISIILNNVSIAPAGQVPGAMVRGWFYPVIEEVQSQWL